MKRWFVLLLLFGSCQSGADLDQPPTFRFGYDSCDYCRMLITEPRYAAALRLIDGQARRFDDIGCLLHYLQAHPSEPQAHIWVNDYLQERWLRAEVALYVQSDRLTTPMGYGIVALADSIAAESLAQQLHAPVLRFEQLRAGFLSHP